MYLILFIIFDHAIDMMRRHVKPDVRIHGIIRNGGQAPNMVPDQSSCELYVRALDRNYVDELVKKVDNCAADRQSEEEITIFDATGMAIQDLICGGKLLQSEE